MSGRRNGSLSAVSLPAGNFDSDVNDVISFKLSVVLQPDCCACQVYANRPLFFVLSVILLVLAVFVCHFKTHNFEPI